MPIHPLHAELLRPSTAAPAVAAEAARASSSQLPTEASSTCLPSHVAACNACKAAGGGRCTPNWGWNWQAPLEANDRATRLPGLRAWRGIDGTRAPGVETVARWNMSNWPSLLRKQPSRVRTATPADRARMCTLWKRDHNYQSFPILLGCPGRRPTEYEPLCANEGAVVRIPCATVDLSSEPTVAGGIFDRNNWFRISHCTHPPKPCAATRAVRYESGVGVVMSVYPTGVGHFVPEQLPRALLLHTRIPASVPIIVADSPLVRRYVQPLIDHNVLPPGRILFHKLSKDGTVLHADNVYTVLK